MIKLVMLVGFLGAGKTTLLQKIIEEYKSEKIGVIVNDFGTVNVDAKIVSDSGIEMAELSNGSIFCACIKDKFVDSLIEMSKRDIEYLFIEASGLADPSSMVSILKGIEKKLVHKYDYKHSLCIIDSSNFSELSMVLPVLEKQVKYCDIIVVNKLDLIDDEGFAHLADEFAEMNPKALVVGTSYCDVKIKELISTHSALSLRDEESMNSYSNRLESFVVKQTDVVKTDRILDFLNNTVDSTYRIKGFVICEEGNKMVSCVGKQVTVSDWDEDIEKGELVVISSIGIGIISVLTSNISAYLGEAFSL